jgi:sugar lactone lactonase YvrE
VHSPKFDEEREIERLRDVLLDNAIEHPVAVDGDMAIWRAWGVSGWPTVVVLDVEGKGVWAASGEPDLDELTSTITNALEEGRARGRLARGDLLGTRPEKDAGAALRYPGKVIALEGGGLAVADTGHHRVVLLDAKGALEGVVGSGLEGRTDGDYANATFRRPEGMAQIGDDLYIADTGNHLRRKVDRKTRAVTTVAGTGELGQQRLGASDEPALATALRSPWDILHHDGNLYVALAGSHQVAAFDPKRRTIRAFAGNGIEARRDGAAGEAAFAQPSALAADKKELYVLDSETSSVRAIEWATGRVRTVLGEDLFVFGDVDGDRAKARLQHPIGLAYGAGALWVADSYNSKLKRVDPATGFARTMAGGSDRRVLAEPAGVTLSGNGLVIADTNHHRLVRYPLKGARGGALDTVALPTLPPAARGVAVGGAAPSVGVDPRDPVAAIGPLRVAAGRPAALHIGWTLPDGTGINADAPFRLVWASAEGLSKSPAPQRGKGADIARGLDIVAEPSPGSASATMTGVLDVVVCDIATHRVCVPVRRTLSVKLVAVEGDATPAPATISLPAAK